jgi:hypothetical protein
MVLAQCPLEELLAVIGRLTAPFTELPAGQDTFNPHVDGEPVLVGAVNGLSYLSEGAGTVFAVSWGFLARVARELDALVLGSAYDPNEEHCQLFVARGPEVVRAFWSNPRRTTRPYAQGSPLPCEANCPLSAPGATGLGMALEAFGFPPADCKELDQIQGERWVGWHGDSRALLESDELAEQVNNHVRAFPRPGYRWPEPRVRVRWVGEGRN